MNRLEHFSCKHDCNYKLLEALSEHCSQSMKILDVEDSKNVDDKSLDFIRKMPHLEELNIFNTKLTEESKAKILLALPKLTRLIRGDFLCDALGWIDYEEDEEESVKLLINEFFPSQSYYFHEDWQMEMTARMCPYISKMFFIFHENVASDFYNCLIGFEYLTDLTLFGGSFYNDKLSDLLSERGYNLTNLALISIAQIDYLALARISMCCPNLTSFSLNNCDLAQMLPSPNQDPNSDEEYNRRQVFLNRAQEAYDTIQPFYNLEEVSLQSNCQSIFLQFLLGRCPNIRRINLGRSCAIDDDVLVRIFSQTGGLRRLEQFHCERSKYLTLNSVSLLMNECDDLESIGDLGAWDSISPGEFGRFRQNCFEANYELDCRSHQKLRKYLEMGNFERKTYVNLITGPTLERIRIAQQNRQQ